MLCIVSAIPEELEQLLSRLEAKPNEKGRVEVGDSLILSPVGIGYLEAAMQLTEMLDEYPGVERLIFTGSAGVYPGVQSVEINQLTCCKETMLFDGAAESGQSSYAPPLPRGPIKSNLPLIDDLYPATFGTGISLTKNDDLADLIHQSLAVELETMELFGVATVCQRRSIPWNAVFGVTNIVGKEGHRQWKLNFKKSAMLAGDFIYERILPVLM